MIISGQKTVTTAGTAERLSTGKVINASLMVKALPANTGNMFIGNVSGDVALRTAWSWSQAIRLSSPWSQICVSSGWIAP